MFACSSLELDHENDVLRNQHGVCALTHSRNVELGRVNTTKRFDDQGEVDEADEHDIEFLEAGEDAAEAFEPAEQALDLVAPLVQRAVVLPGLDSVGLGRNTGMKPRSSASCRVSSPS